MSRANGEPETAAASFRSPLRLSLLVSKGEHSFTYKGERLLADRIYLGRGFSYLFAVAALVYRRSNKYERQTHEYRHFYF